MDLPNFSQLNFSKVAISIADPNQADTPLVYVNSAFEELTGYSAKQSLGKNCRFLQNGTEQGEELEVLKAALDSREACSVCFPNAKASGQQFNNFLFVAPFLDNMSRQFFLGCQYDFRHDVSFLDLNAHAMLLVDTVHKNLETRSNVSNAIFDSMSIRSETALIRLKHDLRMQRFYNS